MAIEASRIGNEKCGLICPNCKSDNVIEIVYFPINLSATYERKGYLCLDCNYEFNIPIIEWL